MIDDDDAAEKAELGPDLTLETLASEEYRVVEEALEALQLSDDRPPQDDLWRILGNLLAWELRERFKTRAGVNQSAETACIRRLITGADECSCSETRSWVAREREQIGAREVPPHQPPYADHSTLWLDETGDPVVYSMHVYPGNVLTYTPRRPLIQSNSNETGGSISSIGPTTGGLRWTLRRFRGTISSGQSTSCFIRPNTSAGATNDTTIQLR